MRIFPADGGLIKGTFTAGLADAGAAIPRNPKGEYAPWQRRFWEHTIRDDRDFERHVDYIHINPVKHGLVTQVCAWPHSSFHRYVHQGLLPADWAGTVQGDDHSFGERNPA